MKINLLDIDRFIAKNSAVEVTNPVFFSTGNIPTEDGLFSTEIFGEIGSRERNENFGWIDLKARFLHPVVYKLLDSIDRNTKDIVSGNKFVSLDKDGYIVEDEQKGSTGIDFYYKNWDKIKFRATSSETRKTKLNILTTTKKNLIFMDKTLVMPAMLRDFNVSGSTGRMADYDVINETYSKIIRSTRGLNDSSFGFVVNNTKYQVQNLLLEIYEKLVLDDLSGKKGLFRRSLMGKSVDYATRRS